ncbi:CocE/NonD family hydrolase [Solibacillus silvestris]
MSNFLPSKTDDFHDYVVYRDVRIPMRDGVELSANICFPSKDGVVDFNKKYPVLLNRSPYGDPASEFSAIPTQMEYFAVERDFVFILNWTRGTFRSDGVLEPMVNEGWGEKQDGVDTVNWIVNQSWCNGKVATMGASYLGGTQYLLQLAGDIPGLETSVITCPAVNSSDGGWIYTGEFLDASTAALWPIRRIGDQCNYNHLSEETKVAILADNELLGDLIQYPQKLNLAKLHAEHSLRDIPIARHVPYYQKWLDNRDNPEFFDYSNTKNRKHDVKKPQLFISGWYDLFNLNTLTGFKKMVEDAPSEEIAKGHRLIVGPWNHVYNPIVRQYPEADTDQRLFTMEWIEQQLNGLPSEFFQKNPVSLFVMGENRWRSELTWPLADAAMTRYYIHSNGNANTLYGRGTLSTEPPTVEETPDKYLADPANPVVSYGGHGVTCGGQADQRLVEVRPDVLIYTSEPLEEDMEVTGYIRATLYAATSATDTDFIMKLVDVAPDGLAYNVVTGGRRGRYLKNGRNKPVALTPGQVEEYNIELQATSYVFKKGHRIRVDICSSDSLNVDVNPNAFIDISSATKEDYVVAVQTVYHDVNRPSMIELPIIPASHPRSWIDEWPFSAKLTGVETMKAQFLPPNKPPVVLDASLLSSK